MTKKQKNICLIICLSLMVLIPTILLILSVKNYKICDILSNEYSWKVWYSNKNNQDECRIFDYFPVLSEGSSCLKFEEGGIIQYFCGDYFKYEQVLLDDKCSNLKK